MGLQRKEAVPEPGQSGCGGGHLTGAEAFCRERQMANLEPSNRARAEGVNTLTTLSTLLNLLLVAPNRSQETMKKMDEVPPGQFTRVQNREKVENGS